MPIPNVRPRLAVKAENEEQEDNAAKEKYLTPADEEEKSILFEEVETDSEEYEELDSEEEDEEIVFVSVVESPLLFFVFSHLSLLC